MKNINLGILNLAFWIEIILSYILPFKAVDGFGYEVGFPIAFITVYDAKLGINPLMSMHLNPLGFLVNGIIIYLIVSVCVKKYQKFKLDRAK